MGNLMNRLVYLFNRIDESIYLDAWIFSGPWQIGISIKGCKKYTGVDIYILYVYISFGILFHKNRL